MNNVKMGTRRIGMRFLEQGREGILLVVLYAGYMILCDESEEDLRAMLGRFLEVCRRICLKVNADKSKVIVLNG